MADGRSQRKTREIPFISKLDHDRTQNLKDLIAKAQTLKIPGFESITWEEPVWSITDGRLIKLTGKNIKSLSLNFHFPPKLGGLPMPGERADLAKSLLVL